MYTLYRYMHVYIHINIYTIFLTLVVFFCGKWRALLNTDRVLAPFLFLVYNDEKFRQSLSPSRLFLSVCASSLFT